MTSALRKNLPLILIFTLVWLLYYRVLNYGFIWDDYAYVVNNSALGQGTNLFDLWTKNASVDFWPITYSFFWLLKYNFLVDPYYYHWANLFLFAVSCVLVAKLLELLDIKNFLLIALIFAVHPMNVSAVSWIFQAKTNLANIFGLLSCIWFIKFCSSEKIKYYLATIAFIVLAHLSKISWIMLPVAFLIYLHCLKKFELKKTIILTFPFFLISLAIGITNVLWDRNALPVPDSELILHKSILVRFLLVGQNFLFYLIQTFFPKNLMFVHPKIEPDISSLISYLPSFGLVIILLLTVYYLYKSKGALVAYLSSFSLSFLFLFPVLGFSEIYFMRFSYVAEHYLTIGLIGFIVPLVALLNKKKIGKIIVYVFICLLFIQSYSYMSDYESEKKLLEINLAKNPDSILPHNILGLLYKNENDFERAMAHYNKSIEIHPNAASYYNKASLYEKLNQLELARANYEKAIELNPYAGNSYNNLAIVYLKLKNLPVAMEYFSRGLKVDPTDVRIYYNIGYAYEENNNLGLATDWYRKALEIQPSNTLFIEALKRVNK